MIHFGPQIPDKQEVSIRG